MEGLPSKPRHGGKNGKPSGWKGMNGTTTTTSGIVKGTYGKLPWEFEGMTMEIDGKKNRPWIKRTGNMGDIGKKREPVWLEGDERDDHDHFRDC
jgi:hypothetical protein